MKALHRNGGDTLVNSSIPIAMLAILMTLSLSGCVPKPKVLPTKPTLPSETQQSGLGSFNLQKRHGLGQWDKNSGPSEQQLLKQMTVPVQPKKETH